MGVKRPSYGMSPVCVEVYLPYYNATKARKSASFSLPISYDFENFDTTD